MPDKQKGTEKVKRGLAQMLKGGVIMDVTTPEQAIIAQEAGAVAVMALERVPADIRKEGGVARMAAIEIVQRIMDVVDPAYMVFWGREGLMSHDVAVHGIDLMTREVIPAIKAYQPQRESGRRRVAVEP